MPLEVLDLRKPGINTAKPVRHLFRVHSYFESLLGGGWVQGPQQLSERLRTSIPRKEKVKLVGSEAWFMACKVLDTVYAVYWIWKLVFQTWSKAAGHGIVNTTVFVQDSAYFPLYMFLLIMGRSIKSTEASLKERAKHIVDQFDAATADALTSSSNRWQRNFWILNISTYLSAMLLSILWMNADCNGHIPIFLDFFTYYRVVILPDTFTKSYAKFLLLSLRKFNNELETQPDQSESCLRLKRLR
jgi:hypothetical protein